MTSLTVIATCLVTLTAVKVGSVLLQWYTIRTKYSGRTRVKRTLNWILNGDFS